MDKVLSQLTTLNRRTKQAFQMVCDSLLVVVCFVMAMSLRLESNAFFASTPVWLTIVPTILGTLLTFHALGLYRSVIRFINGHVLQEILIGVFASSVFLFLSAQLLVAPVPRSVPAIYALLLFVTAGGLRFLMQSLLRQVRPHRRQPVIVYGAGEAGRQLVSALAHDREFAPVAFIDDDPRLQQNWVEGRRVYAPDQLPWLIERKGVGCILLAIPSAGRGRRRKIVASLEPLGIDIRTIPGIADIVDGRTTMSDLRRVTPEDLLGREPVPSRDDLMARNITGKAVLVSGAGGSIGSELCRQIIRHDPAVLVLLEVSELALYTITGELRETLERTGRSLRIEPVLGSVQNPRRVRAILRGFGVQTIYHAAAYKHVVLVEENVAEGIRNNVFGTRVIAEAAAEMGVEQFILISTDKAVRPTNFMGASKRMAELICQALAQDAPRTTFSMVRFGNVLGSSGSVIPRFRAQIERGGPVTVTHRDITRFFMTIPEASQLVIQAGAMARGGDVFVLDMGEPVRIFDLAQTMIRLHGLKPYVIDEQGGQGGEDGDIGIRIIGLQKGEKLFEELLIGANPRGTEHPRIMTATEVSLSRDEVEYYLDRLARACQAFDVPEIRRIFLAAPLAFQPDGNEVHDLIWNAAGRDGRNRCDEPPLMLVET
ncbi:polysaccharide biosynthesis protein [Roseovarius amoyensis]|uniref:polysaccharide biosynthesis protein n=1 Tax=Roseovarius amoyensis TaxID=2211448 RepID=UPI000DBE492F|nr:nucleoside-diphosphate sugar epimerase/dehydratase [Roseovarius amoyensis]